MRKPIPNEYTHKTDLKLTTDFISQISGYLKSSKVKQVMADLALSQVSKNLIIKNL